MKKLFLFFLTLFIIIFSAGLSFAQLISRSTVASSSESFTGTEMSMTYVVGEPVVELLVSPVMDWLLTAGFLQPDIYHSTPENTNISNSLVLYPNPCFGSTVQLAFEHVPNGLYTVEVINMHGKILMNQTISIFNSNLFYLTLQLTHMADQIYLIKVSNGKFQGVIKLIKL